MKAHKKTIIETLRTVLILFLLTGCSSFSTDRDRRAGLGDEPTPIPTAIIPNKPVYSVETGTVVSALEFSGRVAPVVEESLSFPIDGVIQEVFFRRDDIVQSGELIARLDTQFFEEDLLLAQTALEIAQIRLETVQTQLEIDQQRAELNVALVQIDLDFAIAQAGNSPDPEEIYNIARLNILYELAQLNFDELNETIDPGLRADVAVAELRVAELEQAIDGADIYAPFSGVIRSFSGTPGRFVTAFESIGSIADLSLLEVGATLRNPSIDNLEVGMPVVMALANQPGETFEGVIRQLPTRDGVGQNEDETIKISFTDLEAAADIRVGGRVVVRVIIEEKLDVLWLPDSAVRDFNGRKFVVVENGSGVQSRVDIEIGISGDGRVEVVSGLEEGQRIIGQ